MIPHASGVLLICVSRNTPFCFLHGLCPSGMKDRYVHAPRTEDYLHPQRSMPAAQLAMRESSQDHHSTFTLLVKPREPWWKEPPLRALE